MRKILIFLFVFFLVLQLKVNAQESKYPLVIKSLFDRLTGNYNDTERIRINDSLRLLLGRFVRSDSVFRYNFNNLKHLGQIASTDSEIKIISWNLVLNTNPGMYNCYIIKKQEHGENNAVYELFSKYDENPVVTDSTYSTDNWYGALYYDVRPSSIKKEKCWVMLGIDYGNPEITRKIIEVLSFKPDGSISFGKKMFAAGDNKIKFRAVFEYAANAMMSVRFRSDNTIVFDHLVPFTESKAGDHRFYGPDYSFDAYKFQNGVWKLNINVDARNKE